MHFEAQYSLHSSLIVFEIMKQKGCYEYVLEFSYSGIKHGLQNTKRQRKKKRRNKNKWKFSLNQTAFHNNVVL